MASFVGCQDETAENNNDIIDDTENQVSETPEEETVLRRNGISHGLPNVTYNGEDFRVIYRLSSHSYSMFDV